MTPEPSLVGKRPKEAEKEAENGDATPPSKMPVHKYRRFQSWYQIPFDDKWPKRSWPDKATTKAPRWCSVDLRDGNQALINPMNHEKKLRLFKHLLKLGYKEIEVGFPSASQTDFDFVRFIIDNGLIPDDVWIQVLVQCREHLIRRTIESVRGTKNVILHIYNSTSELQRRVVFGKSREDIKALAVEGTRLLKSLADEELKDSNVRLEYSPESYTGTELDFAVDVCDAVCEIWGHDPAKPVILNLPGTVEMSTPNVYADQIEWFCAHVARRDCVVISIHPHNDRGTGTAAAELALMAGGDRIEGCLFGNGERTGNVCLMTLAMNLFTQGIDPEVRYNNMAETIAIAEYCTELKVPERYPWAGSLVYTAFSGSHQDAIKKGLQACKREEHWEVPYLPVDPEDIGRQFEAVIRVNSQSGKGGISYLLEQEYGIVLPKECQADFANFVQEITDRLGREITAAEIFEAFNKAYIEHSEPFHLVDYTMTSQKETDTTVSITADVRCKAAVKEMKGEGNGPVAAFVNGLNSAVFQPQGLTLSLSHYYSVARNKCKAAQGSEAVTTVRCQILRGDEKVGRPAFGVGLHGNTTTAVLNAVLSSLNRISAAGTELLP